MRVVLVMGLALLLATLVPAASSAQESVGELHRLEDALGNPFRFGPVLRTHRLRGMRPEVAAALFSTEDRGELPIEALALPVGSRVALFVEIDGAGFLRHNQAEVARVEVYVYALAEGARVAAHMAEMFTVDVASLGESVWQSGLKFHGGLSLAAGSYELRVLVRNYQSGASGVRRIQVEVPSDSRDPLLAFPGPLQRDAWLAIESASYRDGKTPYPFISDIKNIADVATAAISPAARAVLASGREAGGFLFGGTGAASSDVRLEFVAEEEEPASGDGSPAPATTVEGRVEKAGPGLGAPLAFDVPEIAPGKYRVRLVSAASPASPWVPVAVVGAGTQERELLWSDLRWMLQERPGSPPGAATDTSSTAAAVDLDSLSKRRRGGRAVRRLAARYKEVLGELGSAAPERARLALFDLESEVLGQGDRKAQLQLRTAELSVAEDVAAKDPAGLIPLMLLHSELGEQYRGRRIFSLVSHSRAMVEILAELHAKSGGPAALTASVLGIQGGYLQQANLVAGSRRLLLRACEHDPGTPSALLALAASFEKYSDYNRAIDFLQPLVALRPDLDEAALRLAVNQIRVGWVPRARLVLEAIVAKDRRDWTHGVAVEELARTYLIGGDLERALAVLEPALEAMPRRAGLRLLLAHLYDRQGRVGEALRLVSGIDVESRAGSSARRHYDEWPRDLMAGDLKALERSAEEAISTLVAGLAAAQGAGG